MSDNPREAAYPNDDEMVDEAGRESFPASDPPSFSPGSSHGPVEAKAPVYASFAQRSSHAEPYHASISRHQAQATSAASRCCNLQSIAPWGLFLAATIAGVAVGGMLAKGYVDRG